MLRITGIALLIALVVAASGCGGGSGSGSQPNPGGPPPGNSTGVVVTPATANVYQGMTTQFQAQVMRQSNQAVTWSLEQGGLGTIDSTGLYTAPRNASGGPFHVVATSQAIPSAKGSAAVTVLVPQVTIAPATVTLAPGGTQTFTATVKGLVNTNVTWTVQEAGGGSVSNAGFYNAPQATGFYHVVATSVADATFSGSATISVTTSTGRFTPTGSMQNGRGFHTGTLLASGRVLVAGGATRAPDPICIGGIASTEVYDPAADSFTTTGSMTSPRYAHTATSLLNGKVLVTGGFASTIDCIDLGEPAENTAELYDLSNGSFHATGSMVAGRGGHTSTLLINGKVLVAGGGDQGGGGFPFYGTGSKTAELYDPGTGVFTSTGGMATARLGHTATLLPNGKVLIVGGVPTSLSQPTVAAEIYDPGTGTFTQTWSMGTARAGHTATPLQNGKVLITGGYTDFTNGVFNASSAAELYDPVTSSFSVTGTMGAARFSHTATLLPNGTVLVAGGKNSTAEVYDPAAGSFSTTGAMETGRMGHSATLLLNGKVLVAGGGSFVPLATAELYK
jgi:Bacterial Ig-like domain (group 2)